MKTISTIAAAASGSSIGSRHQQPKRLDTVTTIAAVREHVRAWKREGLRVAFVPTMGNLHPGHVSLIDAARRYGDRFVASIFVNPMQFGPNEDFAHYPRTPTDDERMLAAAGCDLMFMPDVKEVYPNGAERATRVEVPGLSRILCGEFRPGHFEGVATIVAKLFNIVEPDVAVFGEKDFQQLVVIRRMAADLCIPVQIIGAPTMRDSDGLAMSSRNQYLTAAERSLAPRIYETLTAVARRLQAGDSDFASMERSGIQALESAGFRPDYFAIRQAQDLSAARADTGHFVVLTAARLGKARLIDNIQVKR
jgi:pantoate--beta-alanine ligase